MERDEEDFMALLGELDGRTLIVEGIRDERALKTLGLNKIVRISGKPLITVVELIAGNNGASKVVILTDFDSKGRAIAARLKRLLELHRVPVDSRLRGMLMQYGKGKIEDFKRSGLNQSKTVYPAITSPAGTEAGRQVKGFAYTLKGDSHGEIGADIDKVHNKGHNKGQGNSGKT
ncbi:MAG: hypothetical protein HY518_02610 [Candidatus Aenigmarchaeota archaeon]|nr:hypothetical protein [Candidatus Aenigmarchaeota archaeon]